MTFREKLQQEHPEKVDKGYCGGCKGCPKDYGYEEVNPLETCRTEVCRTEVCRDCWDREIPGTEEPKKSLQQLMEEHYSRTKETAKPQPRMAYISKANPKKEERAILLRCATVIAYECKKNKNCDGCVFLDNEKMCVFTPEDSGLFPENWMVPLATLEELQRGEESDG